MTGHISGEFYDPGDASTLDNVTVRAWLYYTGVLPLPEDFFTEEEQGPPPCSAVGGLTTCANAPHPQ